MERGLGRKFRTKSILNHEMVLECRNELYIGKIYYYFLT